MICQINGALTFFVYYLNCFFLRLIITCRLCGLSMWGKITIPMYRLWLNGLYGLYGPRCPLFSKRPINLISLSLSQSCTKPSNDGLTVCASVSLSISQSVSQSINLPDILSISLRVPLAILWLVFPSLRIISTEWWWHRECHSAAITVATVVVPCHVGQSLQLIWRLDTCRWHLQVLNLQVDGLVQERHNSIANALELHLSCTNPSKWVTEIWLQHRALS